MNSTLILGGSIVAIVAISVIGYTIKTYNSLVHLRIDVDRQASHVEVHLKKKFDLIPALAELVKGYKIHEENVLTKVTGLRSQWGAAKTTDQKVKMGNQIESALARLLVVSERYPKLKADRRFQNLERSIYHVEKELVHERKVYNKRVSWYNLKLQEFPSNIFGRMLGFKEKPFFHRENAEE
jgi:LemA protein